MKTNNEYFLFRIHKNPSKIYLKRCKDFIYVAPDEDWDGVYEVE